MDMSAPGAWPAGLTRVPYWVYRDPDVARDEQTRLFEGPVWNFLCLETDIPNPGDYRTTFVGEMPVVVVRDADGEVYAFENRCAHRGALLALEDEGNVKDFQCVYHAWTYDRRGNLKGIAFKDGAGGKGGMPKSFCMQEHGPRKLYTTSFCGLVFGSLSDEVPPLEEYLGEEIRGRIERVLTKPVEVIGRYTQALPNNWKLYFENNKDTYHASLLHSFFATFRITRLTQSGGVLVSPDGGHHASYTIDQAETGSSYQEQGLRSEKQDFRLADPSLLDSVDEFGDRIQLQILTVFPGLVVQQIHNSLAVRQIVPKGVDRMELHWTCLGFAGDTPEMRRRRLKQANLIGPAGYVSMEDGAVGGFVQRGVAAASGAESVIEMGGDTTASQEGRATEASIRGFWKAWRRYMEL
ncbi:MAG TPA: aromatic ring-hydroxylating dioxygenase subunit alpha [Burkholderiales bacterium]|nr:aromatic ring-hydroxylating dioxygenase subunit alpha [Burkholderiales bacterium]